MNSSLFSTGERVTVSGPVANCDSGGVRGAAHITGNPRAADTYERNCRHGCHASHGIYSSGGFCSIPHNVHDGHKGSNLRGASHGQASPHIPHVHDAPHDTTLPGSSHVQASPHRTFSVHSACGCGGQQQEPLLDHDHQNVDDKTFWHRSLSTSNGNQTGHPHNFCERGCCGSAVMQMGRSSDGSVSGMRPTSSSMFTVSGEFQRNAAAVGCMAHMQTASREFVNRSSSPETTSMANPLFASATKKKIILYGWFLKKPSGGNLNTSSSTLPMVAVGGYVCPRMQEPDYYESAPVMQRLERWKLLTSDGLEVGLMGMIDVERSVSNGFSPALVQCFMIGFPSAWMYMILNLNSKGSNLCLPSHSASPSISHGLAQDIKNCLKGCHGLSDSFPPDASAVHNILKSPLFAIADEGIRTPSVSPTNTCPVRDGDSSDDNSVMKGFEAKTNSSIGMVTMKDSNLPPEILKRLRDYHNICPDSITVDEDCQLHSQKTSVNKDCHPCGLVRDQLLVANPPKPSVVRDCAPSVAASGPDEVEMEDVQIPESSGQTQTATELPGCPPADPTSVEIEDARADVIARDNEEPVEDPDSVSQKQEPASDSGDCALGERKVGQHEDAREGQTSDSNARNENNGVVFPMDLKGKNAGLPVERQVAGSELGALLQDCIPCTPLPNPRKRLRGDANIVENGSSMREPITDLIRTAPNPEFKKRLRSYVQVPVPHKRVVNPAVDSACSSGNSEVDFDSISKEAGIEEDRSFQEAEEMITEQDNSSVETEEPCKLPATSNVEDEKESSGVSVNDIENVEQSCKTVSKSRCHALKKRHRGRSNYYQSGKRKGIHRRKERQKSAEITSAENKPGEEVGFEFEESPTEEPLRPTDVEKKAERSNRRRERSAGVTDTDSLKCTTPRKPVASVTDKDDQRGGRSTKNSIVPPPLPLPRVPDKSEVTEAFGLKKSLRGRVIVPPLATWRSQSIRYDRDGGIIAISDGFASSKTESSTGFYNFKAPADETAKTMQKRLCKAADKRCRK